jgi:hypothetical protein
MIAATDLRMVVLSPLAAAEAARDPSLDRTRSRIG